MKSIYKPENLAELIARINKLTPESKAIWGKMDVAQMFAHCSATLMISTGKENGPRLLIGRILGPIFKSGYYNDKPWPKNSPTGPTLLIKNPKVFEKEKATLISLLTELSEGGEEKCTRHPNPFYGKLTPEQIGLGQYKHTDHHLQQFGV